jgi:hypothetical protein
MVRKAMGSLSQPSVSTGPMSLCCRQCALVVFLVTLMYQQYNINSRIRYISLDKTAACELVVESVTGTYTIDADGIWNTNSKFKPTKVTLFFCLSGRAI